MGNIAACDYARDGKGPNEGPVTAKLPDGEVVTIEKLDAGAHPTTPRQTSKTNLNGSSMRPVSTPHLTGDGLGGSSSKLQDAPSNSDTNNASTTPAPAPTDKSSALGGMANFFGFGGKKTPAEAPAESKTVETPAVVQPTPAVTNEVVPVPAPQQQEQPQEESYSDFVQVRLFYALNLLNKNKTDGSANTYIVFKLNGRQLASGVATTNSADAEPDPIWDETLGALPVVDLNADKITIQAYDESMGLIGERELPLNHQMLRLEDGMEKEVNVPFKRMKEQKTGEVAFSIQYQGSQLTQNRPKSSLDLGENQPPNLNRSETMDSAMTANVPTTPRSTVNLPTQLPANEPLIYVKIFLDNAEILNPKGALKDVSAKFAIERNGSQFGESLKSAKLNKPSNSPDDKEKLVYVWYNHVDGALAAPQAELMNAAPNLAMHVQLHHRKNLITKTLLGETTISLGSLAGAMDDDPRTFTVALTNEDKSGGFATTANITFRLSTSSSKK